MISACGVQRAYLYKSFHMRTITWRYGVHYLALCDVLAFLWMDVARNESCMFQQILFVK